MLYNYYAQLLYSDLLLLEELKLAKQLSNLQNMK